MPQIPRETVVATLGQPEEMQAAVAWARRRGLDLAHDATALTVRLVLDGPGVSDKHPREQYVIHGVLEDYDVLPPAWRFLDPRTDGIIGQAAYPQPGGNSVLHSNGVICAPWNRLAYEIEGGPHNDWGQMTSWKMPRPGNTHAVTIPDMLDRIHRDVNLSRGRMAPLPPLQRT
jgi:hypothetical protein